MMSQVPVTGLWLRKATDHSGGQIEVLLELPDGGWRKVIDTPSRGGPISHIVEVAGIRQAPPDDLPDPAEQRGA
jgi:hypothetical protein